MKNLKGGVSVLRNTTREVLQNCKKKDSAGKIFFLQFHGEGKKKLSVQSRGAGCEICFVTNWGPEPRKNFSKFILLQKVWQRGIRARKSENFVWRNIETAPNSSFLFFFLKLLPKLDANHFKSFCWYNQHYFFKNKKHRKFSVVDFSVVFFFCS